MDMIGHQHIGMQVHTGFLQTFSEPMEVGLIVLFGKIASRRFVTTTDNGVWGSDIMHTEASRQALSLTWELNRAWPLKFFVVVG